MSVKGNKNAVGNNGGNPGRSKEEIQELCDKILEWAERPDSLTLEEFACCEMKVPRSTLTSWSHQYPEFSAACKTAKGMLASRWLKGALKGKLSSSVVNNFYYQLSKEHQEWIRELKSKENQAQTINVNVPSFDKKEKDS